MNKFKFAKEAIILTENIQNSWKILIVDDKIDVFEMTQLALSDKIINNTKLHFFYASSKQDAISLLKKELDIAVALIDVKMEEPESGLELINFIRNELKNSIIQLIIRTGHAGNFPLLEIYETYDINNYIEKDAKDVNLLYITIKQAIKSYDLLNNLDNRVKERTEQLFAFMDYTPNFSYIKDLDHKFLIASNSVAEIAKVRYTGDRVIKNWHDLIGLSDHDFFEKKLADKYRFDERKIIESGESIMNVEEESIDENGHMINVLTTKIPLRDKDGKVNGILGIGNNITKLYNSGMALKTKYELLRHVSHDIRNPINAILGYIDILKDFSSNEEYQETLQLIETCSELLSDLRDDILFLGESDETNIKIVNEVFELKQIENKIKALFNLKANQKGLNLIINIDTKIPAHIYIDKRKFVKLIINLISNSIRFTIKGTVELSINLIRLDESFVDFSVTVKDTGRGIPQDKLETIFEPFTYFDSPDGGGLGLAIVYKIVGLLNAKISVQSEVGKGSVFTVIVPNIKISRVGIPTEEVINISEIDATVLVVDDQPANINTIKYYLRDSKIRVLDALDGESAIELIKKSPPDLILIDYNMTGINGGETAKIIRENPVNKGIALICYSSTSPLDEIETKHFGIFDGFFNKAENKNELYKILNSHLKYVNKINHKKYFEEFGCKYPKLVPRIVALSSFYNICIDNSIDTVRLISEKLIELAIETSNVTLNEFATELKQYAEGYNTTKIDDLIDQLLRLNKS